MAYFPKMYQMTIKYQRILDSEMQRLDLLKVDKKDQWNHWIVAHGAERLGWVVYNLFLPTLL